MAAAAIYMASQASEDKKSQKGTSLISKIVHNYPQIIDIMPHLVANNTVFLVALFFCNVFVFLQL